ncbi:hypothetical protein ILUMI_02901 [Ignelater luminosus]|uniref:Uncharacterized protein n=1 Tax=Ignelater luminosus TaxID=2038154 RepID=A0A8K0DBT0_IGNLU|nr:hypothetical protein ILUMI_02901 [Ignelater luminosus]
MGQRFGSVTSGSAFGGISPIIGSADSWKYVASELDSIAVVPPRCEIQLELVGDEEPWRRPLPVNSWDRDSHACNSQTFFPNWGMEQAYQHILTAFADGEVLETGYYTGEQRISEAHSSFGRTLMGRSQDEKVICAQTRRMVETHRTSHRSTLDLKIVSQCKTETERAVHFPPLTDKPRRSKKWEHLFTSQAQRRRRIRENTFALCSSNKRVPEEAHINYFNKKLENDVGRVWEMQLQSEMKKAADEERKLAMEA